MIDGRRLVERPDEVLALGQVDAGLAADRRVDLGDERRRDVDQRHAAEPGGREEPGRVAKRPAADRRRSAPAARPAGGPARAPQPRSTASRFASSPCGSRTRSTASPSAASAGSQRLAGRGPRAGLGDEDRPASHPVPRSAAATSAAAIPSPSTSWPEIVSARSSTAPASAEARAAASSSMRSTRRSRPRTRCSAVRRRHRTGSRRGPARGSPRSGRGPATSGRTFGLRRRRWARTSGRPSSQTGSRPR